MVQCEKGLESSASQAEIDEAEEETLMLETMLRERREATLAAMDKRTRYNETHRAFGRCRQAERRAGMLGAVPKYQCEVERQRILAIYEQAEALANLTGIFHEVDHIVPLEGECPITGERNVSGLHVARNLRAIPWSLNRMRGNRYFGAVMSKNESKEIEISF